MPASTPRVFSLARSFGSVTVALALATCTTSGGKSTGGAPPSASISSAPSSGAQNDVVAMELRLTVKGSANVRAGKEIPLQLELVNRSLSVPYWLGGWTTPPAVSISAQWNGEGGWVDVPPTPVDGLCGPAPFSWTTPVNPIQPGEAWILEDEFSATTARCAGLPRKFVGFQFPRPGRARLVARYVHSGQTQGRSAFGAPHLSPFVLVSAPLEVQVVR
jgi:hypothetical protein